MSHHITLRIFTFTVLSVSLFTGQGCGRKPPAVKPAKHITLDINEHLDVPPLRQWGTRSNCGPTSAAMVLAAYQGVSEESELVALRDALGAWSFQKFALRRLRLPGVRGGMTPAPVLIDTLNAHSVAVSFGPLDPHNESLRRSLSSQEQAQRALSRLRDAVSERKPVLALVQSGILWPESSESLHWVVVKGLTDRHVVINDPADGHSDVFSVDEFLRGWRLNPFFRTLPVVQSYTAIVGDTPLPPSIPSDARRVARAN